MSSVWPLNRWVSSLLRTPMSAKHAKHCRLNNTHTINQVSILAATRVLVVRRARQSRVAGETAIHYPITYSVDSRRQISSTSHSIKIPNFINLYFLTFEKQVLLTKVKLFRGSGIQILNLWAHYEVISITDALLKLSCSDNEVSWSHGLLNWNANTAIVFQLGFGIFRIKAPRFFYLYRSF